jgi:hypothetical protein
MFVVRSQPIANNHSDYTHTTCATPPRATNLRTQPRSRLSSCLCPQALAQRPPAPHHRAPVIDPVCLALKLILRFTMQQFSHYTTWAQPRQHYPLHHPARGTLLRLFGFEKQPVNALVPIKTEHALVVFVCRVGADRAQVQRCCSTPDTNFRRRTLALLPLLR